MFAATTALATPIQARVVVCMAFYNGMRLAEILHTVPHDDRWHLSTTKNGEVVRAILIVAGLNLQTFLLVIARIYVYDRAIATNER